MTEYKSYHIDDDMWYKKREHIYYLLGDTEIGGNIIASYSTKTKRLLIKCADDHIPEAYILRQFVEYCENKSRKGDGK